ncbi:ankyrin repeat domain-containing protein [Nocardia gipuzkoensis]|uniref:ankyrin repeat domain-containing protein n=1 Tax=Nocardia gipuzkoensis TaxID=2749991 RepID=UPI0015EF80D5|nr:ankyrin repeat domain-containing protein [Nocardia gipuzkoensis]
MVVEIIVGLVVILLIAVWPTVLFVRSARKRRNIRLVDGLLTAATAGDLALLRQKLDRGVSINLTAAQGNTALHYAYYIGQKEAVDNLRAFGADENLRNNEGLTPAEMTDLAAAEYLLRQGVHCLYPDGTWRDTGQGYPIYNRLRQYPPRIFNPAVVRQVLDHDHRRELLILAIKLGQSGSLEKLAQALNGFGNKTMAEDYLNSGSAYLRTAAERWAQVHNYRIFTTPGHVKVIWGQF